MLSCGTTGGWREATRVNERPVTVSQRVARRSVLLPDTHVLGTDDAELVTFMLAGQNFSYSVAADGTLTWGAFGTTFQTLGELRGLASEVPQDGLPVVLENDLPAEEEAETVGLELFGNMLDTIAFLRVRLRALADVVIEKGLVSGSELLGRYAEDHERSFQAFRDLMLLKPEVFEERFASWLATEKAYRDRLAENGTSSPEP